MANVARDSQSFRWLGQPRVCGTVDFFEKWQKSWDVYLFAMTVLGAAAFTELGRYALHHRKLTDTHIQVWWLVMRADARCHSEHLEWVRPRCAADHTGSTRRSVLDQHRGATCPFACFLGAVLYLRKDPKWWLGREGGSEEAEPVKEDVDRAQQDEKTASSSTPSQKEQRWGRGHDGLGRSAQDVFLLGEVRLVDDPLVIDPGTPQLAKRDN